MGNCCSSTGGCSSPACCSSPSSNTSVATCPVCQQAGQAVPEITVRSLVRPSCQEQVQAQQWWACLNHDCPAVYFTQASSPVFYQADLTVPVWWKDDGDEVPLCYCKNVTRRKIREAIHQAGKKSMKEVLAYTGAFGNQCLTKNPLGRCCHNYLLAYIQKELGG